MPAYKSHAELEVHTPRRTVAQHQALLEGGCPWCGEPLVLRNGKYGEFIACREWCGFTRSVHGRSEYPPPKRSDTCRYNKCDGSGLLPFTKNGKLVPHVRLHCECHPQHPDNARDRYLAPELADFDFPMSDTFRGWTFDHVGVDDPARVGSTSGESPDYHELWDEVDELRLRLKSLEARQPRRTADPF